MSDASKQVVKLQDIDTDTIFADYGDNFRMESAYADLKPIPGFNPEKQKAGLYEDIKNNGLQTPLWVAKLSKEEAEAIRDREVRAGRPGVLYEWIVMRGHRRFYVITQIRLTEPHNFQKIRCQTYTGLTKADRYKLMADHMQTKGLNDFEVYTAIKRLTLNTGLSEVQIGMQMGKSRGYVQRRKWIAAMPQRVEDNYKLAFTRDEEGKPVACVKLPDPVLVELHKAFQEDTDAGRDPESEGSSFNVAWAKLSAGDMPPPVKSLTRKDIQDKSRLIKEPLVKEILAVCAGDAGDLASAADQIANMRARIKELENLLRESDARVESLQFELDAVRSAAKAG
jgi:hypothetical protein